MRAAYRPVLARRAIPALLTLLATAGPAMAQEAGLVTRPSAHDVAETARRFGAAVRAAGWMVFTEIDHSAAARSVGMTLPARTVILFGNPAGGTPAMQARPTLALDLPMRVLVWEDAEGRAQVTRSTGADIAARVFARHGITVPAEAQAATDAMLDGLVTQAAA